MHIRRLGRSDEHVIEQVGPCFDHPVQGAAATRFLTSDGHHILVAYDGETVAGFVTGVEMTHPNKGTEMFLYELGVDVGFRGRGHGTALVKALVDIAREGQCYGMWVLTDDDNGPRAGDLCRCRSHARVGPGDAVVEIRRSGTFPSAAIMPTGTISTSRLPDEERLTNRSYAVARR